MNLERESLDVFLGLDVGKTCHHAVALNLAGKKLYDKALPQDETKIQGTDARDAAILAEAARSMP